MGQCFVHWLFFQPSNRKNTFLDRVEEKMKIEGCQSAINHELLSRGLKWRGNIKYYEMEYSGKQIIQSDDSGTGVAGDLAVPLSGDRRLEPQGRGLGCG
jgi:hypothetical protein